MHHYQLLRSERIDSAISCSTRILASDPGGWINEWLAGWLNGWAKIKDKKIKKKQAG
jgi:hypothetical protein